MSASGTSLAIGELLGRISKAKEAVRRLRHRDVDSILATLDQVVSRFLDRGDVLRRRAEADLPPATGFSGAMVRHGLPLILQPLRGEQIRRLLENEIGDRSAVDVAVTARSATAANLIVHILSGNIPALGAAPLLLSLAIKSAVVIKPAAGDPVFPALLHEALAQVDPLLAECVVVAPWRGGDREIEDAVFAQADLVVASGSDGAIAAIRKRVAGRFIGHGHKISFAVIAREALDSRQSAIDVARRLAYDVTLWDQQGCLSPQVCFIEPDGVVSPSDFATRLGAALLALASELPPRRLSFEEGQAIQTFRQTAEWDDAVELHSSAGTEWSVSVEARGRFQPTCLNRCLRLVAVDDLDRLPEMLAAHRRYLEAAGLAVGDNRADQVSAMLMNAGVHRICALGTMQLPSLDWRQGGRPRIAEWVQSSIGESTST